MSDNPTERLAQTLVSEGAPTGAPSASVRKRGRPPLPRDSEGNIIHAKRTANPREVTPTENAPFVYNPSESGIKAAAKAFGVIWYFAAPFIKARQLTEVEQLKVGEALDPILQKYVPMYDDWKYEINLTMVLVGVYQVCREDYAKPVDTKGGHNE